jgi:hypothetical protein
MNERLRIMRGRYTQGNSRVGRKKKAYGRTEQRIQAKRDTAAARAVRGPSTTIVISTNQNTPEWEWFSKFVKGKGQRNSVSVQARESLRSMIELHHGQPADETVSALEKMLKARILELEFRDNEILNLRHALGYHSRKFEPNCEACTATSAEVIRE